MVETIYTCPDPNALMHHGVKGMKWGVRKPGYSNSAQIRGHRAASKYGQKRDIRKLKEKKRSGQISAEQYVNSKNQIKTKAMVDRGKFLVTHNQGYMNTTIKALAKNAAVDAGSLIVASMAMSAGAFPVVPVVVAANASAKAANTVSAVNKIQEIGAYDRSKKK